MSTADDPRAAFIDASVWHGALDQAQAILAAHPEIAGSDIYVAAILGDPDAVRRELAKDPRNATATGGPRGWDALTYLCFSKYLRLDPKRSAGFVRAATALLDAGADANTGFHDSSHQPKPTFESALYGAAGVAHHAGMTRLLLARGADPNDEEVPYHSPETDDNRALWALVESGRLTADSLAIMLVRKADWHDFDGINYLLDHGADPNRMTMWHITALHQAVRRDNDRRHIEAMLEHGGDPLIETGLDGRSAIAIAARRGRADLLDLFEERGIPLDLRGVDRLVAACARGDEPAARAIVADDGTLVKDVMSAGGSLLAEFAGTGNAAGVRCLLDLGVDVNALYDEGDGYFGVAPKSTALHVAAWRAQHEVVELLLDRGARLEALDGRSRTPLALAVRACVDSYWMSRRSPRSVAALLRAGASARTTAFPSGYGEVDELLKTSGA
jgi:ankyrin repeat protein